MTTAALERLHSEYDALCDERQTKLDEVTARIASGGSPWSEDERASMDALDVRIDEAKEHYEVQRDYEAMAQKAEPLAVIEREVQEVSSRAEGEAESKRKIARDLGGQEGLNSYDERAGEVMEKFALMSANGDKSIKLEVNPHRSHNFQMLRDMGVSTRDFIAAVRSGHQLIAGRNEQGNMDVRAYNIGTSTEGGALVPTFWDDMLYLFASYVGGVQAAGAEILPMTGPNTIKLNVVTGYAAGLGIVQEPAAPLSTETEDTVANVELTPRPYRGFSGETDEIMRAAAINVRMMLVLRGLSRALQLGKEGDFHSGNGVAKPKGILNGVAAGRLVKTGGNTTNIQYKDIPEAMGLLDAEYHMAGRPGALRSLMHSAIFWNGIVGATATDGHPLYPMQWIFGGGSKNLFETEVVFSSQMVKTPAANALLSVHGNFMDAYVIATTGTQEIEVSDDVKFLQWQRVYRIQEYCDGTVRDNRALAYVQSAPDA